MEYKYSIMKLIIVLVVLITIGIILLINRNNKNNFSVRTRSQLGTTKSLSETYNYPSCIDNNRCLTTNLVTGKLKPNYSYQVESDPRCFKNSTSNYVDNIIHTILNEETVDMIYESCSSTKDTRYLPKPPVEIDIPNLVMWFDASDASSLYQDTLGTIPVVNNNDPVRCWKNKASNLYHVTDVSTIGKPPQLYTMNSINNLSTVRFYSINWNRMKGDFIYQGTQLSVFIVSIKHLEIENLGLMTFYRDGIPDYNTNDSIQITTERILNGVSYITAMRNMFYKYQLPYPSDSFIVNTTLNCDTQIGNIYVNGTKATTNFLNLQEANYTGNLNSDKFMLGGKTSTVCDSSIGEVIVFTRDISEEERNNVLNYLSYKWNISIFNTVIPVLA